MMYQWKDLLCVSQPSQQADSYQGLDQWLDSYFGLSTMSSTSREDSHNSRRLQSSNCQYTSQVSGILRPPAPSTTVVQKAPSESSTSSAVSQDSSRRLANGLLRPLLPSEDEAMRYLRSRSLTVPPARSSSSLASLDASSEQSLSSSQDALRPVAGPDLKCKKCSMRFRQRWELKFVTSLP